MIQGLSTGGSSTQEVLDENKDNIEEATLTGILKGTTSYLTEKMFDANIITRGGKKTSIEKGINRLISRKINSKFGKELAHRMVGILGENIEEQIEDNSGYVIDKLVNNKDLPTFQEWWNNATETAKITTLSTTIMGVLGLGGESFHDIEMDMETEYWVKEAQKIIEKENLAIHFNPNEVVDLDKTKTFYITRFTPEGEIANIVPTKGKAIYNPKTSLNVIPVVVKDSQTNSYNVIDGNTGVILDNTYYATTMEAEGGFFEKANNLTDLQIKDINTKISEATYLFTDKIINMITEAKEQVVQNRKTNINNNYTEQQFNDVTKLVSQIQDKSIYNNSKANNIFKTVSNNINNIDIVFEDNVKSIKAYDNQGNVTYQEKLNSKTFTGSKIKDIINNAIQNADISFSNQSQNTNTSQNSQNKNVSTFYNKEPNYVIEGVEKVMEPFDTRKTYSKNELADIWNNEIAENEYDVSYDKYGNIQNYIAIEEDGKNLVISLYDGEDNIVTSETISNKKGKYSAKDITNAIEKVSRLYDENRPIKGQQDIEGNEVMSMKKEKASNEIIFKSIQKFNEAKKVVDRQDIINVVNALNVFHKNSQTFIDKNMATLAGNNKMSKISTITEFFKNYKNKTELRKMAGTYALEEYKNETIIIKDTKTKVDLSQKGLKKTFNIKQSNETLQTAPILSNIIKESIYVNSSIDLEDNNFVYHYFYSPISVNGNNAISMITIKEIVTDKSKNPKFYYHDIREINNEELLHAIPQQELSKMLFEEPPSINNSISQKTETVKSEKNTVVNNKSMQKSKNNTELQNDNIRSLKKNNSETNNAKAITDNQGRKLSTQQQVYFKDSKVKDANGNLIVVYHGTPSGDFNVFNDGTYFTANKDYANRYQNTTASSISSGKQNTNPKTYEVYLNIRNPFDIRDKKARDIYINDYIKTGNALGINPYESDSYYNNIKTIDWTEGEDLREFLKENYPEYDGLILDEGGEFDENNQFKHRGVSYVIFNANQIKNVDNINPTANDDIRFAKRSAKTQKQDLEKVKRNAEREGNYIEQEIQKIEQTGSWDNSIPVTKLTDIRKTIEEYLGLGIKKGHFRQKAYAIYKTNRDVIRTKELKDMDSILHETGHALDLGDRLKVDKEAIADELLRAIDKLGGYEKETRAIRLDEGFAEVIREYSIIPKQTKIEYPQTVSILEKLRQVDKGFNDFMTKVQEQTYNYIHQNPRNRTLSNQSIGEQTDRTPLTKNWVKQEVMRNIWDKDYALKSAVSTLQKASGKTINQLNASNNAYYLARLISGIGDKVTSMLANGYIDTDGNKLMPGLNKIGEILKNDPERFNDLRAYLLARRDTDYKSKSLKTGVRTTDSMAVIEQFKNDSQIQEASKLIYDTLDGVMQYVVNNNLISQETADNLRQSNAFYVPMQRVLENRGNQVGKRGAVVDVIKKRTGSELDVKDVLENIISNSSNIIQQVENNNILKALYRQGEESGITGAIYDVISTPMTKIGTANLKIWQTDLQKQGVDITNLDLEKTIDLFAPNNKIDRQNLITSFIDDNGKRVYLQFNDELIFNSIMNMDKKFMSQVLKITSKMNMPLRYGATMANIGFAIPNMISDTAQASIYSTAGFIPVVDNALGILDILATTNKTVGSFINKVAPQYAERINKLYTLYNQSGATNSTRLSQYRDSTQNVMKDIYGTKKSETLGIKEKYKPLKRLLDLMTYIPEISEQSTRFEVFKKNYEYYKEKGNNEMDTRVMAALESRDASQDFGRTGNITKEINQLIPFSAARVGGAYTFAEKVKANPKQVGVRIAILTVMAMAIKGLGYDDKEIEELNQRKKDDNFVFEIGDNVITIKKPQGILRSMINLAEYIQDLATGHIEEGKEGARLGAWLHNAIMDNMPADSITGFVPNALAPLIENAINKDFYYNTDIIKGYDLELPNSEQYYDYNSQLAIIIGKVFNYSPAKIDNLISGYFGGLGTQITSTIDTMLGKLGITSEKPEMGAESNSIGKRFFVNVNSNSTSIDEVYNRKTELTKKKNGGTITDNEAEELETITNAIGNMSKLNKQIKEIKKDLSLSGKEKAEKIKLLQQQKTDTARQALGKDIIYPENENTIQDIQFYPSSSTLKKSGYSLELSSEQKKEYEQIASEYYNKNKSMYNKEKQDDLKSKAKDYAKSQLIQKYKSNLVKSK